MNTDDYPSLKEQNTIHDCLWKQTAKGFEVWWSKDPLVRGSGKTLFQAEEVFAFSLAEATKVYPPGYRYVTPPPADEEFARYQSDWVVVSGMNAILRQAQPLDDLFEGGCCKTCGIPQGRRNDRALRYEYSSSRHEDVVLILHGNTNVQLLSEKFLEVVLGLDGDSAHLREATCVNGKPRSNYFELVASDTLAAVGCESEEPIGRSCGDCKSHWVAPRGRIGELRYFFDADDMAAVEAGWIPFWTGWRTDILVHLGRWRSAQGVKGLKGVVGDRVGILPKALQRPVEYEQVYPVQG